MSANSKLQYLELQPSNLPFPCPRESSPEGRQPGWKGSSKCRKHSPNNPRIRHYRDKKNKSAPSSSPRSKVHRTKLSLPFLSFSIFTTSLSLAILSITISFPPSRYRSALRCSFSISRSSLRAFFSASKARISALMLRSSRRRSGGATNAVMGPWWMLADSSRPSSMMISRRTEGWGEWW